MCQYTLFPIDKTLPLDYSLGLVGTFGFNQGTGPIVMGYLNCSGSEADLTKCNQNYRYANTKSQCLTHYYDAAVKCEGEYYNVLS